MEGFTTGFPEVMEILEKSLNFKTPFSRHGKVMKFSKFNESFGKAMKCYFAVCRSN